MEKVFNFIKSLSPLFLENLGNPTIKFHSDCIEVYFDCVSCIRDVKLLDIPGSDEFRMFVSNESTSITIVYTFYI